MKFLRNNFRMENHYNRYFTFVCLILCQYLTITHAIRALRLPASITVIEGGTAEFNCTTADKAVGEELYWAIKWDDGSLLMWYYLPAAVNKTHEAFLRGTSLTSIRGASLGDHGRYSTVHREVPQGDGSNLDLCLLQVDDIHDKDRGKFHCVYRTDGSFRNLYAPEQSNQAQLKVVVPPDGDAPSCDVSPVASADPTLGGALVELSCISSMIAVNPLPTITWITGDTELSSTTGNANLYRYTLKERDNGREFVCLVTHPSLTSPSTCSVLPLNEPPNAIVTPENLVAAVGSDAVFKCIGSGIPYIVKYTWFIGESSFSHSNRGRVITPEISFAGSEGWTLSLPNLKHSANNTIVTCEVSLPSGLSTNASALLFLRDSLPLSVTLRPKRTRVFKDSDIIFSCFAETEAKHLIYKWYIGESLILLNATVEKQSFKIRNLGRSGSILQVSKEQASAFENDVIVTCEAVMMTGGTSSDSGLLIAQKNTRIEVDISPKVIEIHLGVEASFRCVTQPDVLPNSTISWLVRCDPDRPTDTKDFLSKSESKTITLNNLKRDMQCDVTCTVSLPSGLSASSTGLVVVQTQDPTASLGEVQQPETRSTSWRLPGALGAGGIGIFLGIFFCSMLLLLYGCSKSYTRYNKTSGTAPRGHVGTPIYETVNPQCGSRDQAAPELPMVRVRSCHNQQQSNATYNRPPMTLPKMQVAMPAQREGLQRIPSSEEDEEEESVTSSISKDSLNTELGMNSSPSTATFGGPSDSEEHEYERCEITTCV